MSEEQKATPNAPITVTDIAKEKLKELMGNENKDPQTTALRVFVQGGGCSGFQYGLMLDESGQTAGDQIFESNEIKILVDPISIGYLKEAEVDYTETSTGGGFSIKNPQATSTCGCGQSFNTE